MKGREGEVLWEFLLGIFIHDNLLDNTCRVCAENMLLLQLVGLVVGG